MSRPAAPVPPRLLERARRQGGLLALRQCLAAGMTRGQVARRLDRKEWEPVARGVLDTGAVQPSTVSESYDLRRRRAALLGPLVHPGGIAVGVCSLVLQGVQGAPVDVVPQVAVPRSRPRTGGGPVRVRRILVPAPVEVDGILCAPLRDSLALAVPALPRLDAVAMIDSAWQQRMIDGPGLLVARGLATGRRGARASWPWWEDADQRAESPAESWARITCLDLGIRPDAVQLRIQGRGWGARVDLAWSLPDGTLLLVEIDGADVHSAPEALFADRRRQNRIDTRRTLVRRYSGNDARSGRLAAEVQAVLTAACWRPHPIPVDAVYDIERAELILEQAV
ncbi:type IV toxin-antitoxin system AbiEi family antitoxin domain-containing protein [Isoptericola sp. NPDC057391]|uniref:type IV toxin-antitoxin system AbiEi family antitoxin domain-containing protein n=1 Tax=Isoptericola sp. NPDC057391 TaxID=3346117 RepID=UPI003634BA6B